MSITALIGGIAAGLGSASLCQILLSWSQGRRPRRSGASRPLLAIVLFLGRALGQKAPKGLPTRLAAGGLDTPARQFMAIKTGSAAVALLCALALVGDLGSFVLLVLVGLPILAFFAPDLWLKQRTNQRIARIDHELGDVLELVRVAIGAGMGVRRALAEVGYHQKGLIATELRRTSEKIAFGETYEAALDTFEQRCPTLGIATFVATVKRAQKHGTPLSEPLNAIVEQARADYARKTAETAARAAPKIQLIVALLLVPSVMLLIAATVLPMFTDG